MNRLAKHFPTFDLLAVSATFMSASQSFYVTYCDLSSAVAKYDIKIVCFDPSGTKHSLHVMYSNNDPDDVEKVIVRVDDERGVQHLVDFSSNYNSDVSAEKVLYCLHKFSESLKYVGASENVGHRLLCSFIIMTCGCDLILEESSLHIVEEFFKKRYDK
ncbi:hypothetical protein AKO1_001460 [Acrasis kona]|uniref:Uncharacterized protein n=1 Tax=Acrasis kona TaxID=1008807 RepID=A0AAW2Z9M5_9EUKA